jgi:hypothetical protein
MRRSTGLLEHVTLGDLEIPNLPEEERSRVAREYGTCVFLNQLSNDQELRRRVRAFLADLPADKPGPEPVLSDKLVYELVEALIANGYKKAECYKLLSRDGLTTSSVETKYKRWRNQAIKKGEQKTRTVPL